MMKLPNQSPPVMRQVSTAAMLKPGIAASSLGGIACTICHAGCSALPEPAKTLCNIACDHTVC